ncbi:MAG: hypothetical protein FWC60_10245 [Firmicutes bacterium]|nr:hypothetical protein [Bacillota bacterium]
MKSSRKSNYLFGLAAALFFFFGLAIITGLLTAQNHHGYHAGAVHRLHAASAIISTVLAVAHLKLNWPYLKRLLFNLS